MVYVSDYICTGGSHTDSDWELHADVSAGWYVNGWIISRMKGTLFITDRWGGTIRVDIDTSDSWDLVAAWIRPDMWRVIHSAITEAYRTPDEIDYCDNLEWK